MGFQQVFEEVEIDPSVPFDVENVGKAAGFKPGTLRRKSNGSLWVTKVTTTLPESPVGQEFYSTSRLIVFGAGSVPDEIDNHSSSGYPPPPTPEYIGLYLDENDSARYIYQVGEIKVRPSEPT